MRTLWLMAIGATLAACAGSRGALMPSPAPAGMMAELSVGVVGEAAFGERVLVEVLVTNPTPSPIALLRLEAATSAGTFLTVATTASFPATFEGDWAQLDGLLLVEDIGPEARLPAPPRWEWTGASEIVTVRLLRPGESFRAEGAFRLTERDGDTLSAALHYALVPTAPAPFRLQDGTIENLPPPITSGRGWAPALHARARFVLGAPARLPPDAAGGWTDRGRLAFPAQVPALYPAAWPKAAFERFPRRPVVQKSVQLTFRLPAISLDLARSRAGITAGAQVYVPPLRAWLLESRGRSALVSEAEVRKLPGKLAAVASVLAAGEEAHLSLYTATPAVDPDGLVAFLAGRGFRASSYQEKGGFYSGEVVFGVSELVPLVQALAERGLRVMSFGLAKTPAPKIN